MNHKVCARVTNCYSNSTFLFSLCNLFVIVLLIFACESGTDDPARLAGPVGNSNANDTRQNASHSATVRGGGLWAPNRSRNVTLDHEPPPESDNSAAATPTTASTQPSTTVTRTKQPTFVISNIRHHRSRKIFVRTTTTGRTTTTALRSNVNVNADDKGPEQPEYKTEESDEAEVVDENAAQTQTQDYQADSPGSSFNYGASDRNRTSSQFVYGVPSGGTSKKDNSTKERLRQLKDILLQQSQASSLSGSTNPSSSQSKHTSGAAAVKVEGRRKLSESSSRKQIQTKSSTDQDRNDEEFSRPLAAAGATRARPHSRVNSSSLNFSSSFPGSLRSHKRKVKENQLGKRLKDKTFIINNSGRGDDDSSRVGAGEAQWSPNPSMQADDNTRDSSYQEYEGDEEDYEVIYATKNQNQGGPSGTNYDYRGGGGLNEGDANANANSSGISLHENGLDIEDMDIVSKFLRFIEENTAENCTAGTDLKLGQGVVDRYAQERFRLEAEVAVNRANMLTRIWKYSPQSMDSEYLLHAAVISLVEFDDDIFAGGNCYDKYEYKNYTLFCPFGHRTPEGNILVKDLAVEYKYLTNTSEFFWAARKNAEKVIKSYSQFSKAYHQYPYNDTFHYPGREVDEILNVTYDDGKWSEPYFDCGGGNIWMMTYTVPFFGYRNNTYFFKGTSGIDIDLRRVDIDQCYANPGELNLFANSNKCKNTTTQCVPIKGLGFRRGSYKCECRRGFYFPNTTSSIKYFNGSLLEEEYENKFYYKSSRYDEDGAFECMPCPIDCETCEDDRPCVVTLNWVMRTAILILQGAIILMLPIVGLFTWKYSEVKVVRAASPVLLRFIVLGAFFIYCTTLVMYPTPSLITCTLRVWLREIGFSLAYGALMLKTWRISVIFRVRSAKAVKITDLDLMKRLGIIVAMFTALLVIRTLVSPPHSVVSYTAQDLKAWLCQSDWWDHSFTIMELSLLVWGIRLCIVVRKAPSEFNESKFISLAIYNEFLLSLFLNISMLFLQSPANPDLLYIIFFCHVQLTMTLLLCLIFGSKAYMVFRGHDKNAAPDEPRVANSKFLSKSRSSGQSTHKHGQPTSGYNSIGGHMQSSMNHSNINSSPNLSNNVLEEFHRIYMQLEELKKQNLKLGEIALVGKIIAMQEAANKIIIQTSQPAVKPSPSKPKDVDQQQVQLQQQNALQTQLHQTLLGREAAPPPSGASHSLQVPNNASSSAHCSASDNLYTNAAVLPGTGSSSGGAPRKKSIVVLSNISEEELNLGPLSACSTPTATETQDRTKDNNYTAVGEADSSTSANTELKRNSITGPETNSQVSSNNGSNNRVHHENETSTSVNVSASVSKSSGESCRGVETGDGRKGSSSKTAAAEVQVLVSCHSQEQQQQQPVPDSSTLHQQQDDISPTSPSENEVQVGDEVYMDAVEEDDDGPTGGTTSTTTPALAPRASEEHESDLDDKKLASHGGGGSSSGRKKKKGGRQLGSNETNKKYYSREDTIEYIDEDEDAIIQEPIQSASAAAAATSLSSSAQNTKQKQKKSGNGKGDGDGDDKKEPAEPGQNKDKDKDKSGKRNAEVILDLDDKSRFTEEITV